MAQISLDNIPLVEFRPYDVHQLQAEFHCYSPREAYGELCRRAQCHASKAVAAMLPSAVGAWDKVRSVDLSQTYVGPKGVVPVIELCKRLPSLYRLSLAGNYLQNDSVWFVAQLATYHPTLAEVDISNNEFVSWSGAMCLATAVVQNVRLTMVNLSRTAVEAATAEAVFYHTRQNAVAMAIARGRTVANPTSHPAAIHLRAMRRYFDQIRDPITGCVTREELVEGYAERLRTLGRSGELEKCKATFFEVLAARAPSDRVTWEMFLVLVLLDAVEYVDSLVAALRRVFLEFNLNANAARARAESTTSGAPPSLSCSRATIAYPESPNAQETASVLNEGFVDVGDFPAVHLRLYGTPLSPADAAALRSRMGLEPDGCTVNWDAFLYLWYGHGPAVGAKLFGSNLTQLPRTTRPTHR